LFWAWIALGVAAIGGFLLLPCNSLAANTVYDGIGVVSAAVMVAAARQRRPPAPSPLVLDGRRPVLLGGR
jgi:hypothetical protein